MKGIIGFRKSLFRTGAAIAAVIIVIAAILLIYSQYKEESGRRTFFEENETLSVPVSSPGESENIQTSEDKGSEAHSDETQGGETQIDKTKSNENQADENQYDAVKFTDAFNGNIISPNVADDMKSRLLDSIAEMKEMGPGVGPWRIEYCNREKIILYNYAHIVACDITEKGKGIYSVIDLRGLKTGSYQGSIIAMVYPSPDAMCCILGTGYLEKDIEVTDSLYLCNFYDGSVKELETNYNMVNSKVTWYRNVNSSGLLPWYVSIEKNDSGIIWDIENGRKTDGIPAGSRAETIENGFVERIEINTGYSSYLNWWKADENTMISVPYNKHEDGSGSLKLTDFEIIEVNLKDKTGKVLYRIN